MIDNSSFVHLHNHTDYSLLDGAAGISKLVKYAASLGMKALAITDHGNMFGVLKFYKECRANNIKPIIGNEFYIAPGSMKIKSGSETGNRYYHLVLLAKNQAGYRNLMKLSSIAYIEGFYYKPRIDFETLKSHSEGLICLSACIAGLIPSLVLEGKIEEAEKAAIEYQALFGKESYYLELQDHGIPEQKTANAGLIKISQKTGIPVVATNDIHYVTREESDSQEVLICIGTQKKLSDTNRLVFEKNEFYLKSAGQMIDIFRHYPEAAANTLKIADMCNLEIELPGPLLPDFEIPGEFNSPDEYLRHLTYTGLKKRYPEITDEIKSRADFELEIITSMGFTGYFLIVWDFIRFAREKDIPVGPGRGSGAGSVAAYSLYITDIDPFKYNLLFERFLNPERVSMPDFDIDFCYERRQEVIDYIAAKYGENRVCQIITFGSLMPKAVLKDVARVLEIPFEESNTITKYVANYKTLTEAIEKEDDLKKLKSKGGVYSKLVETSLHLEGLSRHTSLHAAGIVIGKEDLVNYVPLYKDPKTGAVSTQFTMNQLEECGLVKMDLLGLRTLTLIENTVNLIRKNRTDLNILDIPENDEKTFKMLSEGKSACVFQFESPGMQKTLKDAKPECIEDLIALNALYRPGPMKYIQQFIDSKKDRSKIKYPHPALEEVLKQTYGVIVYQEQVMQVAQIIGGFSLGKADILRKAMGKKLKDIMAKMKEEFMSGAENKGFSKKLASDIFELLLPFAEYGFNKAHAAAYSVLAYRTAYLKANYPAEFMSANLTNEINDTKKLSEYISETRQMGIEILAPDINLSEKYFTVSADKIVYGLMGIKNTGAAAVEAILQERTVNGSYRDFSDFLERIDLRVVNKRVMETLIKSGLFDKIEKSRSALFHNLDRLVESAETEKENKKYGQTSLFDSEDTSQMPVLNLEEVPEWPEKMLLSFEKENLGFYFSSHPLKNYTDIYNKCVTLKINEINRAQPEKKYTVMGIIKTIKEFTTKTMQQMASLRIETYEGEIDIVCFPSVWTAYKNIIEEDKVLGFAAKADIKGFEPKLICEQAVEPETLGEASFKEIHFVLSDNLSLENLDLFKSFLLENNGNCQVYFHIKDTQESETIVKAASQINVRSDEALVKKAEEFPFISSVWRE